MNRHTGITRAVMSRHTGITRAFMSRYIAPARALTIVAILAAVGPGCAKKHIVTGPTPPSASTETSMTGVFVGANENGLLDLTIEIAPLTTSADTVVAASGVMSPDGGGVINLTGSFATATDSLYLHGQGFSLAGLYLENGAPTRLAGTYSGPAGSGSFTAFTGARPSVQSFCATYENNAATRFGTFDLVIAGSVLAGFEVEDGDTVVVGVLGQVTGSGTSLQLAFAGNPFVGTGTWQPVAGHVAGTYTAGAQSGVWSGDRCVPGTTGSPSP